MTTTHLFAQPTPDEIAKITDAAPETATATLKQPRKLLVFTRTEGFVHASIPYGAKALEIIGKKTGAFAVEVHDDMAAFEKASLAQYDAICFLSTTQLNFENETYRQNLMDFVNGGNGIVGIHAATDNFYTWPEAAAMMGGLFDGHPWHSGGTWAVKIDDPEHPVAAAFGGEGFAINDELYRLKKPYSRENLRVLLSLNFDDEATNKAPGIRPNDFDVPVSWVRSFGAGRVFYSSLGHNPHVYWNPAVLQHYLGGIQFALGDLPADTTPSLDMALSALTKYDYGQSLAPLVMIDDFIRFSNDSAEALQRLENRFLQLLASDLTLAGRQFICEKLRIIGSEKSVPVLANMLAQPATVEMARYALEGMQGAQVDTAVLAQLTSSTGRAQIGLISTLGLRRVEQAAGALTEMLASDASVVVNAAAAALANIATRDAVAALEKARKSKGGAQSSVLNYALLRSAEMVQKNGEPQRAITIYRKLYEGKVPEGVQAAALRGLVLAQASDADKLVIDAAKSKQSARQMAAIALLREIDDSKTIQKISADLPRLPESAQIQMLAALAERGQADVLKSVVAATESKYEAVRVAALQALAQMGDPAVVDVLVKTAAQGNAREAEAARLSLNRLPGTDVDETIRTEIARAKDERKTVLIHAAGERKISSASQVVIAAARDGSSEVRVAAARALRSIGEPEQLPEMVAMLVGVPTNRERRELELAIPAVAKKIAEPAKRAQAVLAVLPEVKNEPDQVSMLTVLGRIGDTTALPTLQNYLTADRPQIAAAAIRALSDWPDSAPETILLAVATSARHDVHRILGLRGYVRMLSLDTTRTAAENVEKYRGAMALAQNAGEQRMVLSGLSEVHTPEALAFAAEFLGDAQLQQEAAVAAIKISSALIGQNVPAMSTIMARVANTGLAESLRSKADSLALAALQIEDHITDWLIAGPYKQDDANLLEYAFAPEQQGAATEWQPFQSQTNSRQYWRLELDKVVGGDRLVVYLRTEIWSEKEQTARLEMGSDDGLKTWLNGELVHENDASRGASPGDDIAEIKLKKGWNSLMLKVVNKGGGWAACARIRQQDGSRLEGLKIRAEE